MVVVQLKLGPEFDTFVRPVEDHIRELLAGQAPVFFDLIVRYEGILVAAVAAKAAMRDMVDILGPTDVIKDAQLREEAGFLDDANSVITRGGNRVTSSLKQLLEPGRPYVFGNNRYFVDLDPRQREYPGRRNFYLLGKNEEYPIGFGGDVRFDPIQEPIKPASVTDVVTLVRDLQITVSSSQQM
jgi:hypothetical protein